MAPMMWVLFGLVCVETAVLHGLVALWSGRAALIFSALGLGMLVWVISLIRSLRRLPVILTPDHLIWRCGSLRTLTVPVAAIAGLPADWDSATLKSRAVFNGALIAYPNILIALDPPVVMGRRQIRWLAHKLDEPQAFVATLDAIRRAA